MSIMDTRTKVLFIVLLGFTFFALAGLFYKTMIIQDFQVISEETNQ